MKSNKKLGTILLAGAMVLSAVPTVTFATESNAALYTSSYGWPYNNHTVKYYLNGYECNDSDVTVRDSAGNYVYNIHNLKNGEYTATLRRNGYSDVTYRFTLTNSDSNVNIEFGRGNSYNSYGIAIRNVSTSVRNRITGYTESYASVALYDGYSKLKEVTADGNGYFTMDYNLDSYGNGYNNGYNNGYYNGYRRLSPSVGYNSVTGSDAPRNALINVYDSYNNRIGSGYSDSYGNYNISFSSSYQGSLSGIYATVADYNGYNNGYYNGYRRLNPSVGYNSVTGSDAPRNALINVYDSYNNRIGSGYSDSYGNYNISFSSSYQGSLSGIYATVADYNGYNNGYNNGYGNYKNLYLVATKGGYTSDKYYLSGVNNNTSYETAKEAKVTNANPNTSFINGYNVNAGASVSVKDSSGTTLGTATADANGYFVIYTNRALKSEETLTFTTHVSNSSKDAISTYKVGSDTTKTTTTSTKFKSEFTIGSSKIEKTVDGVSTLKYMDVVPYIKDGRTMMPVRYVAEALGYTVTYNKTTRMASFTNGSNVVLINIDSDEFYVNGEKHTFTVKPEIKDARTMLPISEVGKALGLTHGNKGEGKNIEWDAENKTVTIQKDK